MTRKALFPTRWKHDKPPSIEAFLAEHDAAKGSINTSRYGY